MSITSCKKTLDEKFSPPNKENSNLYSRNPDQNCDLSQTICEDCLYQQQVDDDTADYPTVLGSTYNNPYSKANMTAAYNYIYSSNIPTLNATHYYVRYKPASREDLNLLDSFDVELYDYPLDRHVLQDGDYWPEAYNNLQQNEYPWLYSVIEKSFILPGNIQTQILDSLYIPGDNQALEDEAYYISGNSLCDSISYLAEREATKKYYHENPDLLDPCMVDPDACGGTGGGGGGGGGSNTTLKPKGMISFETDGLNNFIGASAPLKYVRVVGKRFFKIDKTYTDANGNFQFQKSFPRKVTIVVKLKTSVAKGKHSVRTSKKISIQHSMFPLKKNIGTYKGNNLQNLNYQFEKGSTTFKKETVNWVAAVAFNTAHESRDFLASNNLLQLPNDVRIHLYEGLNTNPPPQFDMIRRSSAPLLNQERWILNDIWHYGGASVLGALALFGMAAGPGLGIPLLYAFFSAAPQYPDVYLFYRTDDINSVSASKVSFVTAQQLGIVYLNQVIKNSSNSGVGFQDYFSSLAYVNARYPYDTYAPFGNGLDVNEAYQKELVAIWQTFAQHLGHVVTDRFYSTGSSEFSLQGKQWVSGFNTSSNLKYLEEFDPSIGSPIDYFHWIPVGIINDLMDNSEPLSSNVNDNVSGFSIQEIQSTFLNKPSTLSEFKTSLKNIKPLQSTQIDQLFVSYGY